MNTARPRLDDSPTSTTTIGRRVFLGAVPALLLALRDTVEAQGAPAFVAYHDATHADHQKQFDAPDGLLKRGFRVRSLSVYRNASTTLYAAVWTNEPGPSWQAFHGLSPNAYQQFFNTWTARGYRPVIVTATGGGEIGNNLVNDVVMAGVFEQDATPFSARHNISGQVFRDTCDWARQNQHVLRCASIYGGRDRLYAAVWERTATPVAWDYRVSTGIDGPEPRLPLTFPNNAALKLAFVTRSPFGENLGVYRAGGTGLQEVRNGLTSAQYQAEFNALTGQGFTPQCVQAGGDPRVGNTPRFNALFDKPAPARSVGRRILRQP